MKTVAVPTSYKGVEFRSRLEARWAVFFQEAGLDWTYEPQNFSLGKAGGYCPDFFIHNAVALWRDKSESHAEPGFYLEVKPEPYPGFDISLPELKCQALADLMQRVVILVCGDPLDHMMRYYVPLCGNELVPSAAFGLFQDRIGRLTVGTCLTARDAESQFPGRDPRNYIDCYEAKAQARRATFGNGGDHA